MTNHVTDKVSTKVASKITAKIPTKTIDPHVYEFIDESGKKRIQHLHDFAEENKAYLDQELVLTRQEQQAASHFWQHMHELYLPFTVPARVVWDRFQTGIRRQLDRNTCSGFAMVAAIEARYKHDYGLDLDLSEQFYWHRYKSTTLSYPRVFHYENQSSFWGGGGAQGIRQAVNFAIPLESECPYLGGAGMRRVRDQIPAAGPLEWHGDPARNTVTQEQVDAFEYSPLYISDHARQQAKYGVKSYVLYNSSLIRHNESLEFLIACGHEVIVDANLKWRFNPSTGVHEYDASVGDAAHVFLVVGYDRDESVFYVKNSWGEPGLIRVSYEFARHCFGNGAAVTAVTPPNQPTAKGRAIGRWHMNHDGWRGELVIRRYTDEHNERTRLGHYRGQDGAPRAVNGVYVDGNRGIQFQITNGDDTNPSAAEGQAFHMDVFSWDIEKGAGSTTWNNIPFGSYISRTPFQSAGASGFEAHKWIGNWSMDHDGWRGQLSLQRLLSLHTHGAVVVGEYRPADGAPKQVIGLLDAHHPHILRFTIPFSPENHQPFVLHFHTWSADLSSGETFWNGGRFGVVAFKQ